MENVDQELWEQARAIAVRMLKAQGRTGLAGLIERKATNNHDSHLAAYNALLAARG